MSDTLNLAEIEARAKAAAALAEQATAGPWAYDGDREYLYSKAPHLNSDDAEPWAARITSWPADWPFLMLDTDIEFSAASRTAVPALAADVLALLAQLVEARALLAELLDETGLKESYTARDGTLHPGATSTVKDVWRFLWGEGKTE